MSHGFRLNRGELIVLAVLALVSLAGGARHALRTSDDLLRRAKEVALVAAHLDPYGSPDMTYPPTAIPVFAILIAPFGRGLGLRAIWLGLNLAAVGVVCATMIRLWARDWPVSLRLGFALAVAASMPVRRGLGLGQFHLMPLMAMLLALRAIESRRPILAGILLGAALTKPTMVVPFVVFLAIRRDLTVLAVAAGYQAASLLGVSAWLRMRPETLVREWLDLARMQQGQGLFDIPSVLEKLGFDASSLATPLAFGILGLSALLMFRYRFRSDLALCSFALFAAAIFTYHRSYDLVLLLPAFMLHVDRAREDGGRLARLRTAFALVFGLLLIAPEEPFRSHGLGPMYDWILIASGYAFLAFTTGLIVREPIPLRRGQASDR